MGGIHYEVTSVIWFATDPQNRANIKPQRRGRFAFYLRTERGCIIETGGERAGRKTMLPTDARFDASLILGFLVSHFLVVISCKS